MHDLVVQLSLAAVAFLAALLFSGFAAATPASGKSGVTRSPFGSAEGKPVDLFTLRNAKGMEVGISALGGIVTSIKVPDRHGKFGDVSLSYAKPEGYLANSPYLGALIGRFGNRIAHAAFALNGVKYKLPANNGPCCLHGGAKGFDKILWQAKPIGGAADPALELSC